MSKLWIENNESIPAAIYQNSMPAGDYSDKSSDIVYIASYWYRTEMTLHQARLLLKSAFVNPFNTYTSEEQDILKKYAICDPSDRVGASIHEEIKMTGDYANQDYALYEFIKEDLKNITVDSVDYSSTKGLTQNVQRKDTFTQGRLVKVEYFETYNEPVDSGTNKLIEVDISYVMDADNFVDYRTTTRKWYLDDNTTIGYQIVSTKYYSNKDAIREGVIRRQNIIDIVSMNIVGMIAQTESITIEAAKAEGASLFSSYEDSIASYTNVNNRQIVTDVTNDTALSWLNNDLASFSMPGITIRDYINSELNY